MMLHILSWSLPQPNMKVKLVLNLCLVVIFAVVCEAQHGASGSPARLCVPAKLKDDCQQMQRDLPDKYTCVIGRDKLDCARKLENNEADLANLDERSIFLSGKYFGGIPIAFEYVDGKPYKYEGVALVSKESNITQPEDLRGRRSCHTGVGRTVGWVIPVAALLSRGIMSPSCNNGELGAVEDFFSNGSCAPGNWSSSPLVDAELKKRYPKLCMRCADPSTCSSGDRYAGYEGVVRCVSEGSGDVAFTKAPVVQKMLRDDPSIAGHLEYLCLDGGRRPLTEDSTGCGWGVRPSNAFVTTRANYEANGERYLSIISETQALYPAPRVRAPEWFYKTFFSGSKTTRIEPLPENKRNYRSYLGDFIYAMEKPRTGCTEPENPSTFCVISQEERSKCEDLVKAAEARSLSTPVKCVNAVSKMACMETLKQNNAELLNLDGGDVYIGGRYYSLQPVAAEIYGESNASYYAVAVIRSQSDSRNLSDLRGLRSCHTGMGRTAGWVVPVGALLHHGGMNSDNCNRAASVADFFSDGSCVPGANDTKYNPGRTAADKLCQQCIGDLNGEHKCNRDSKERYNGYAGAFRCLVDGHGDVAFVKHTTVPEYTDGNGKEAWSRDLLSSDFKLLCGVREGTAVVREYLDCNLARVPSHHVMTSEHSNKERKLQLARLLADISKTFSDDSDFFKAFDNYGNGQADLIFKDSTTALQVVKSLNTTYVEVLGGEFLKASIAVDPRACQQQ